jgi:hypothetical protein
MEDKLAPNIIEQRIRNRIFEYLEGVAEYPRNAGVWDLGDVINGWETWVDDPFEPRNFPSPVFTPDEVSSMAVAHAAWLKFADAIPKSTRDERVALSLPEWKIFADSCANCAEIFGVRGRVPEDIILDNDA